MEEIFKDFAAAISPALQQLVIAMVIAALTAATGYIKSLYDNERAKLSGEKQYLLDLAVENGVKAAEQLYGTAKEQNREKLDHAFNVADETMKSYGFNIDARVIYAAIEAKVYALKSE